MKCPKCGYENNESAGHCDLCQEVFPHPTQELTPKVIVVKDSQETKKPREEFKNPLSLKHLLCLLFAAYLLFRIVMALMSGTKAIVGQVGINTMLDKAEKGTYNVKDYLSAQDKVKYDQAMAAIDLLEKVIRNKVRADGVFPSSIDDLRKTKDFDEKKLIDPFSPNGQYIKYQVEPAGRGNVNIYSIGPDGKDDGGRSLSWDGRSGDIVITAFNLYPLESPKTDVKKYGKEYETLLPPSKMGQQYFLNLYNQIRIAVRNNDIYTYKKLTSSGNTPNISTEDREMFLQKREHLIILYPIIDNSNVRLAGFNKTKRTANLTLFINTNPSKVYDYLFILTEGEWKMHPLPSSPERGERNK